jgi:hypothetical protein
MQDIVAQENRKGNLFVPRFRGRVDADTIKLSHSFGSQTSFLPVFRGNLAVCAEETRISGVMGLRWGTIIFMWIFRTMTLCFALLISMIAFVNGSGGVVILCVAPLGMFAASFALVRVGQSLGKPSGQEILKFIEERLKAHRISPEL